MRKKTVAVEAFMEDGFTMTAQMGNHTLFVDQPEKLGGKDKGPSPVEYLLFSYCGCLGAMARILANKKRIELRSIKIKMSGDLDLDALSGRSDGRKGLQEIVIEADINADMTNEEKDKFMHEVESICPVSDNIINSTPVSIKII